MSMKEMKETYEDARKTHARVYEEVKERYWDDAKERARVGRAYDAKAGARRALVDYAGSDYMMALDALLVATEKYDAAVAALEARDRLM